MAFDLVRVLRTLLFASPGSLSVKDIQTVFTRFHEEAANLPIESAEPAEAAPAPMPVPAQPSLESPASDASASPPAADAPVESTPPLAEPAAAPAPSPFPAPLAPSEVPSLVTASQIRDAMEMIRAQLETTHEVFRLQETHTGWRLVTSADGAEWVRLLRNQPRPLRLSQSALETLAIVAYRQPVVRAEIESIRGVSVESAINRLLERELIKITGRADLPGRPIQYGTTEGFLDFLGLKSLEELPASDVLSAREIDAWLQKANTQHPVTDREVGLDTESGDEEADLDLTRENALPPENAAATASAPTAPSDEAAPSS